MTPAALRLLLQGLARRGCAVEAVEGLAQPVLAPMQLLLPPGLAAARAAIAHAAAHLRHSPPARDARQRKPLALAVLSAVEDARVERLLVQDFPGVRRWFAAALPAAEPQGLGFAALMGRLDRALADPAAHDGHHWVQRAQQGFWALPADAGPQAFADLALRLANMLGQMRVPYDTQYRPGAAYRDDHSYLWDHGRQAEAEPLPALGGAPATPGDSGSAGAGPALLRERHYGEWHEKLGLWRPGWCRVQERAPAHRGAAPTPPRRQLPPSSEGERLDLPAAVAAWTDRRRSHAWDTRLFRRSTAPAQASVLLLLDLSQSTLAPWGGGPASVQAAEQRCALALARRLADQGARVAVHGFSSNGRAEIAYWRAVDFGSPCDAAALAALPVRHSTRLGAALRHAQALLAEQPGPRRSLLLLSDGAPWDIDVFEAKHLLHDARHAVQALRAAGTVSTCLAFAPEDLAALHTIFGMHGVHVLVHAGALALDAAARVALGR
ncbi:nitric oxide reductase activation protein NorD [Pseudorhodoferax sp.]|uniref:nitric oxide reductase activation protein NorD n=1 Tax=Pseudorhodoferax sp. TaxID=1993553 RepID=UPI002DD6AB1D|nr:VWA domain-containing protein [Pseudorhodoferax sp.]